MSNDFTSLGIRQEVSHLLAGMGITRPTPIQAKAIPTLMAGKDLVAQSQTGTGKTFAFLLPIMEKIQVSNRHVQALVITPTRELALQIAKEAEKLGEHLGITVFSAYGGVPLEQQLRQLKEKPQIVIGTPGRLLDHVHRQSLNLARVSKLVLDEADQMLDMGFLGDIEELIHQTPASRQTMLFSATIPSKIRALAARYMNRPTDIRLDTQKVTLDEIKQTMIETKQEEKIDLLCKMIDEYRPYLAMVFCHTKQRAIAVCTALVQRGYDADELHGDLSQSKRTQVMRRFRTAKLQVLVVTDIAARGIDIEGITHIFNYDIPHDAASYIHRIGRTGRAGRAGAAITFVVPAEQKYLRMIEQGIHASIKRHKTTTEATNIASAKDKRARSSLLPPLDEKSKAAQVPFLPQKRSDKKAKHAGINLRDRKLKSGEQPSVKKYRTARGKRAK